MARACIRLPGVQRLHCVRSRLSCRQLPCRRRSSPADEVDAAVARRRRRPSTAGAGSGAPRVETLGLQLAGPEEQEADRRGRCLADSLIRREPDADDTIAGRSWCRPRWRCGGWCTSSLDLGLPVDPFWSRDGGLAFDLLSSYTDGREGDHRARRRRHHHRPRRIARRLPRITAGSPRRALPHDARPLPARGRPLLPVILVENGSGADKYLDDCRGLFGDERVSYTDAIARHYKFGAPDGWEETFISEYATMHPWEDFAECFAHYLHITDTIDTSREAGWCCRPTGCGSPLRGTSSRWSPTQTSRSSACSSTGNGCRCSSTG